MGQWPRRQPGVVLPMKGFPFFFSPVASLGLSFLFFLFFLSFHFRNGRHYFLYFLIRSDSVTSFDFQIGACLPFTGGSNFFRVIFLPAIFIHAFFFLYLQGRGRGKIPFCAGLSWIAGWFWYCRINVDNPGLQVSFSVVG
jgi:hypothetical protein